MSTPPNDADVISLNGVEYHRSVQHRCVNIGRHVSLRRLQKPGGFGCDCHRPIPEPCPDCYAIEVLTRQLPWSALNREPQPGASGVSS